MKIKCDVYATAKMVSLTKFSFIKKKKEEKYMFFKFLSMQLRSHSKSKVSKIIN